MYDSGSCSLFMLVYSDFSSGKTKTKQQKRIFWTFQPTLTFSVKDICMGCRWVHELFVNKNYVARVLDRRTLMGIGNVTWFVRPIIFIPVFDLCATQSQWMEREIPLVW